MPAAKLPRLATGIPTVDAWIEAVCAAIDRANNVTAEPPVLLKASPDGLHLTGRRYPTPVRSAKTTTTITARSGTTPGKGNADLYHYEGTSTVTLVADSPTVNVEVLNDYGTAVTSARWIKVDRDEGGRWTLVGADCP
jgi:hypothetical protein